MLHRSAGFTLIELLIAIIIFVLISIASYKMLTSVTNIQNVIEEEFQQLNSNVNSEIIMEHDFLQVVGGITLKKNDSNYVFKSFSNNGVTSVKFLRQGWQSTLQEARSDLLVVTYSVVNENLIRYSWAFDEKSKTQYPKVKKQILWQGITSFKLRFLDSGGKWHNQWPVITENSKNSTNNKSNKGNKNQELIPNAVEIRLVSKQLGANIMIFPLPYNLTASDIKSLSTTDAQLDNITDSFMQGLKNAFQ